MAIVGHGIDVVDIVRFDASITRTPELRERLFAPSERELPVESLAARFAAKEALVKALGGSDDVTWVDVEILRGEGRPEFRLSGAIAARIERLGLVLHLSISHDAGMAVASVIAEER
jgi:holo-[acyl-carrier protein] synthase